jgi:hypothetical protein
MKWVPYALLGLFSALFAGLVLLEPFSTETLYWLQPAMISLNLLCFAIALAIARNPLLSFFRSIPRKFWIAILLIFLFGLSFRLLVPPKHHKIYYDEDIYLDIAHNIANQDQACLCDYGTPDYCYECIDNKQPMAMPTFYSLLLMRYSWLGFGNELSFFITHIILSSIAILALFLLSMALTQNGLASLLAALALAVNPTHIRWSVSTSQDAFFVPFLLLTFLLFYLSLKEEGRRLTIPALLLAAFTLQIRTEGFLILAIMGVMYLLLEKRAWARLGSMQVVLGIGLLLLFIAPTFLHIANNKHDSWGAPEGKRFSIDYMRQNSKVNTRYFFQNTKFPAVFTYLALIGLGFAFWKHPKNTLWLLFWFFILFLLYALFYAGSFEYGMDVRFVLAMLPVVFIFAGLGAMLPWGLFWAHEARKPILEGRLSELSTKHLKHLLLGVIFAGLALSTLLAFYANVANFGEEASDAMLMHKLAAEYVPSTHEDCIFLSQVSSMFRNLGRPSIQMHRFMWGGYKEEVLSKHSCIYLYWGYWCANSPAHEREQCRPLLEEFNFEKTANASHYEREFAFYRLSSQQ